MPEKQPTATTEAKVPRRFLPWWLPGLVAGLLFAAIAFAVIQSRPATEPKYRVEALVQLPPGQSEEKRRSSVFLLSSRDLVARVVAEPAVSAIPSVRATQDPVSDIAIRLNVTEAAPDVLAVTLTGDDPDDMKAILDHLVKRYVDDATAFERKERQDQVKKLEQLSETLRMEIEAMEKQIELMGKANGTTGSDDNAARLALLQKRHIEADSEYGKVSRDLTKLEAELAVLNQKAQQKDAPPDPARAERVAQLATEIEVLKVVREKLKEERDSLQKLIAAGVGCGLNIQAMRDSLKPQREQLDKINTQLAQTRLDNHLDRRARVRGEPSVSSVRTEDRHTPAGLWAAGSFAAGFVLATVLSLLELAFRVLRKWA